MSEKNKLIYTEKYTTWNRDEILSEVKDKLTRYRYEHVLRVETCAIALAEEYGADVELCSLAAILHDYAKDIKRNKIEKLIEKGFLNEVLLPYGSQIWHGPAGAHYAKHKFGVTHEDVLNAISQHTIGGQEMSLVSKILFVADYIESGRAFKGVEEARRLAKKDLDRAVYYKIKQTLIQLVKANRLIYPETLAVYNAWVKKGEDE